MDARQAATARCAATTRSACLSDASYRHLLRGLGAKAERFAETLDPRERRLLDEDWASWARPEQWNEATDWTTWLMLGGRGSGKTRAGAEFIQRLATGRGARGFCGRIALVAETQADAREVMVEGESGLLSLGPAAERPRWTPSRRRLEWPSGAVAHTFSAEAPDGLRGPQFGAAWCDELAKWPNADATWANLQFALRLGRPCQVVTTTPRNVALVRRLLDDPATSVSRMRTADNAAMLAPSFLTAVVDRYRGTRLGRQELDAELLADRADALWSHAMLDGGRVADAPDCERVVVGVDPPVTATARSDACGIVVAGVSGGRGYVLADRTVQGASPAAWAARVAETYAMFEADRVVVEVNQGGDMVESVLRSAGHALPIRQVRATRGKATRAEPVAALYERQLVRHAGTFGALEDEMCDFGPDGLSGRRSPDRVDALVWALSDLMLRAAARPRLRTL